MANRVQIDEMFFGFWLFVGSLDKTTISEVRVVTQSMHRQVSYTKCTIYDRTNMNINILLDAHDRCSFNKHVNCH